MGKPQEQEQASRGCSDFQTKWKYCPFKTNNYPFYFVLSCLWEALNLDESSGHFPCTCIQTARHGESRTAPAAPSLVPTSEQALNATPQPHCLCPGGLPSYLLHPLCAPDSRPTDCSQLNTLIWEPMAGNSSPPSSPNLPYFCWNPPITTGECLVKGNCYAHIWSPDFQQRTHCFSKKVARNKWTFIYTKNPKMKLSLLLDHTRRLTQSGS